MVKVRRVYLDTSIFYSAVFQDEFFERADKILTAIGLEKISGYTSLFTLTEFLFTLQKRNIGLAETKKALDAITLLPNILILTPGIYALHEAINYRERGLDMGDALHTGAMKEFKLTEIASFDSDFDKIKEIKRITSI